MEFFHRVGFVSTDASVLQEWRELGFEVLPGHNVVVVAESDRRWPLVADLRLRCEAGDLIYTEFSVNELDRAALLQMRCTWTHQYPQPEEDDAYQRRTYSRDGTCFVCGVHGEQVAPFRLRGEPRWGSKEALQINWLFDEFFVKPQVWQAVFDPLGVACKPVLRHSNGEPLSTVVQLVNETHVRFAVEPTDLVVQFCVACRTRKYYPVTRGTLPPVCMPENCHIARTVEYFGDGAQAFNAVLVSAEVYRRVRESRIKGLAFNPVPLA